MSKLFQKWFGRTEEHVSDDHLLALLDGELSLTKSRSASRHLESCWECRARFEQVEGTIVRIVGYRKQLAAPFLPPPLDGRDKFLASLDQLIEQSKLSWGSGLLAGFSPAFVKTMNPVFASVAVVFVASLMLFLIWERRAPSVSASELLQRAEDWDRRPSQIAQNGVVFQKVRIHTRKTTTERTLYRDVAGRRKPKFAVPHEADAEVNQTLARAGIDWQQPLSAGNFRKWHDRLAEKIDEVQETSPSLLTLVTSTDSTDVKESSLSVRKADFHPVACRVVMRDSEEIEVSEVNYDVLNWDAVNATSLFVDPSPALNSSQPVAPQNTGNPLETELAVRYALHGIGADLGEPIDIQTDAHGLGLVSVVGIVSSLERKRELLLALRDLPQVTTQLQTEEEAAQRQPHAPVTRAEPKVVVTRSPIEQELLAHFGHPGAVETFSKRAAALTEDLMAHAWALRHLSERYSIRGTKGELTFSASSRQLLQTMRRDHLRAMSSASSELENLLGPVLQSIAEDAAATSPEFSSDVSPFDGAQRAQRLTLALLSGASDSAGSDSSRNVFPAKQSARDLLGALRGLEITLEKQP